MAEDAAALSDASRDAAEDWGARVTSEERRRIDELLLRLRRETEEKAAAEAARQAAAQAEKLKRAPVSVTFVYARTGEQLATTTLMRCSLVRELAAAARSLTILPGWLGLSLPDTASALDTEETLAESGVQDGCRVLVDVCPAAVTTSEDRTARVWDLTSGRCELVMAGHEGAVYSAAFDPTCRFVLTCSEDCTAILFKLSDASVDRRFQGHTAPVLTATFASDGLLMATCSEDRSARVWNVKTTLCTYLLKGHAESVNGLRFVEDDAYLHTSAVDGTLRVWAMSTGLCVRSQSASDIVYAGNFSRDGASLAITRGGMDAELRDPQSGKLKQMLEGHEGTVVWAAFLPADADMGTAVLEAERLRLEEEKDAFLFGKSARHA